MNIQASTKQVQTALIDKGYQLVADGVWGIKSATALKDFETKNNLPSDGIVDDNVLELLGFTASQVNDSSIDHLKAKLPTSVYEELVLILKDRKLTNLQLSHFLSQVAHESGNFKFVRENLNYSADGLVKIFGKYFNSATANAYARQPEKIANRVYANRMGNGNEASGDGYKFRGRGYIQLTGCFNYTEFDKVVADDILANPDLVATKYPLTSALFFFDKNNLWAKMKDASTATVTAVTKSVNGGTIGLTDRINHFNEFNNLA